MIEDEFAPLREALKEGDDILESIGYGLIFRLLDAHDDMVALLKSLPCPDCGGRLLCVMCADLYAEGKEGKTAYDAFLHGREKK